MLGAGPGWTDIVTAVGTGVVGLGVIAAAVGAVLAWRSVKEDAKGRHAQIAVDFGKRWDSEDTAKVKQLTKNWEPLHLYVYCEVKKDSNSDDYYRLERFANFFEDLGVLNRLGILDIEWIDETLGSVVVDYWRMWKLATDVEREFYPKLYENWQNLAELIEARRAGLN